MDKGTFIRAFKKSMYVDILGPLYSFIVMRKLLYVDLFR